MAWNILSLSADFFVLAGAVLQVAGTFWVRHLSRSKGLSLPAGGTGVDVRASRDNLDIFSFLSIGAGSVYFILNDIGLSTTSEWLLALCLLESIILVAIGFESYSALAENYSDVLRFPVWPLHMKFFLTLVIAEMMIPLFVALAIAMGAFDFITTLPLLAVFVAVDIYFLKSLDFKTVRKKQHPGNPDYFLSKDKVVIIGLSS